MFQKREEGNKGSKFSRLFTWSYEKKIGSFIFKIDFWILLIIILGILVNFYGLTQRGIHSWDEGDYLTGAKSVLQGDIRKLGVGYKFVHNFILVVFFALFGAKDYVGFAASGVFALLTAYLVYLIGDKLYDRRVGIIAALILTVTEYFIYFSRSAMADLHLSFFITLTMFVYINTFLEDKPLILLLTGFLAATCYTTKNTGAFIFIVILLAELIFFLLKKQTLSQTLKRCILIAAPFLAIVSGLVLAVQALARSSDIAKYKTVGRIYDIFFKTGKGADFSFYFYAMLQLSTPLTIGLLSLGMIRGSLERKEGDYTLLNWLISMYLFFSLFPQHRVALGLMFIPAVALLAARGLTWLKRSSLVYPILLFLIGWSLFNSINTLTLKDSGYRQAASFVIKDGSKGVIATSAGRIRFYLSDLPLETWGFDLSYEPNPMSLEGLKELSERGYTHIAFDWRAGRVARAVGGSMMREFRDTVIENLKPIKVIDSGDFYADEANRFGKNYVGRMSAEEKERYREIYQEELEGKFDKTERETRYDDKYRYFSGNYYLENDPHRDRIYIFRLLDVIAFFESLEMGG